MSQGAIISHTLDLFGYKGAVIYVCMYIIEMFWYNNDITLIIY